jgi:hypothetical protein
MRIVPAGLAMSCVGLFMASSAAAHDDQGLMTAEARPGPEAMSVTARAQVVFANDQHPTDAASVTVTGVGPNGAQVGPTPLTPVGNGEYEGLVAVPATGDWSFQFTSTNPAATAASSFGVSSGTVGTPPTTEPRRAATSEAADDDSSGVSPVVIAFGGAVVVPALVACLLVLRRRR